MSATVKRISAILAAVLLTLAFVSPAVVENTYAAKIKLNKKSLIIGKGESGTLKVKGTKAKVKWSSTNKKVATVSKKGVVKGKGIGNCTIKAKVSGKTLKCTVRVRKKNVASAMNLRNYILKHGKKSGDGEYYIHKKWKSWDVTYDVTVKAHKYDTEMEFESKNNEVEEDYSTFRMTIDLINEQPGDVWLLYGYSPAESDTTCEGTVYYDFCYDYTDSSACGGVTVSKVVYTEYDFSTGDSDSTVYTDPSYLSDPSTISTFCMHTSWAFGDFDTLFKKCGLKYRMKKLGFKNA